MIKSYFNTTSVLLLFALVTMVIACNKDGIPGVDYRPNVALPLVKSAFTLKDILKQQQSNNNIVVGNDGFIDLVFTTSLFSKTAQDLIKLDNQLVGLDFNLDAMQAGAFNGTPNGTIFPTVNVSKIFPLGFDSAQIDTLTLKSGSVHIVLESSIPADFNLTLTFPETKQNNIPLVLPFQRSYNNSLPIIIDTVIDLSNYNIGFVNTGGVNNGLITNVAVALTKGTNPVSANDIIGISIKLEDIQFKRIYGKFPDFKLTPQADTVQLSLFETSLGLGTISLDNPKLTAKIKNSFGVHVDASFIKFQGYNKNNAQTTTNVTGSGIPNPLSIQSPSVIGQTSLTQFTLDKLNSNIVTVLNKQPMGVIYQLNAKTSTINSGFIMDTSKFEVEMEIDIPLSGSIDNFIFKDTIDYVFDQGSNVESVTFRTNVANGFPFEAGIQVYFADSKGVILDSLVKDKPYELLLTAASVDATGKVNGGPSIKQSDLKMDSATLTKLVNIKKFIIESRLSSTNQGLMKIYNYYNMDIKLGVMAKLKL